MTFVCLAIACLLEFLSAFNVQFGPASLWKLGLGFACLGLAVGYLPALRLVKAAVVVQE